MVNSGIIIWKLPVSSFSSLASTYPSPTIGFTAQTTSDGKVFRFNGSEWAYIFTTSTSNNINYLWIEEKTINAGSNSFTLTNSVTTGQKLTVVDKKYGVEWIEGVHWNRSSSVVTLTESSLVETLTFRIINWG
jgi:hypothetical protein